MSFPKMDGFVVFEKLGSGSYATVYKAYTKVGARNVVAIKCIDKSRIKHSGSAVDNLISEIRLLKNLSHPHIVKMIDFLWDERNIYIITEYCCGGDLSMYIHRYGRIPEKQVLYFLQQLVLALKFLREKGVVHMDLKPHNLLLHKGSDGKYILKVADFGFASTLECVCVRGPRGSPLYMAPEMLTTHYDDRVDLWSLGVIMYECLFGKAPYSSTTFQQLIHKIQTQQPIHLPSNSDISSGCRDLLLRLLRHSPDERITYEQLFAHTYLDLEHAPNKTNYDKGVSLLYAAVAYENACDLEHAVSSYGEALRYLLPCLKAEIDQMKKAALTDKLTRYMDRAEEIKQYLKYMETGEQTEQNIAPLVQQKRPLGVMTPCCLNPHTLSMEQIDLHEASAEQEVPMTSDNNVGECSETTTAVGGLLQLRRRLFRNKDNESEAKASSEANTELCRIT